MRRLQLPSREPDDTHTQGLIPRVQAPPPAPNPPPIPAPIIVPRTTAQAPAIVLPRKAPMKGAKPRLRSTSHKRSLKWRLIAIGAVLVTALATIGISSAQALQEQEVTSPDGPAAALLQPLIGGTPVPSGHAPSVWGTQAAAAVVVQKSRSNQLCNEPITWPANIDNWTVPPGCYGDVYKPNPANYPSRPGFGWCNWWVRVNHPDEPDITENKSFPSGSVPHPGNAVFFYGGVQGADSAGHWAQVVAVNPDGYWVLISEMNFSWRGAGWARVDFRYIHVGSGVVFIYAP